MHLNSKVYVHLSRISFSCTSRRGEISCSLAGIKLVPLTPAFSKLAALPSFHIPSRPLRDITSELGAGSHEWRYMSDHLGCWEGGVEEGTNLTFACEHGVGREGSYGSLICGLLPGRCTNTNDEGSRLEVRLHLQPLSLITENDQRMIRE